MNISDMKILICDDSILSRKKFKDCIVNMGCNDIYEAADGEEVVNVYKEVHPNLVFMDIVMPKMDGVSLLKILNEKKYLDDFPVLMVTGENSFETLAECFNYGASDYIRKPVQKDFVTERVEKLTELYLKNNEYKELKKNSTLFLFLANKTKNPRIFARM